MQRPKPFASSQAGLIDRGRMSCQAQQQELYLSVHQSSRFEITAYDEQRSPAVISRAVRRFVSHRQNIFHKEKSHR